MKFESFSVHFNHLDQVFFQSYSTGNTSAVKFLRVAYIFGSISLNKRGTFMPPATPIKRLEKEFQSFKIFFSILGLLVLHSKHAMGSVIFVTNVN